MLLNIIRAFYGAILYTVFKFVRSKDKDDAVNKKFNIKAYLSRNWENMLFSLLVTPVFAIAAPEILEVYNNMTGSDIEFKEFYYFLVGILVEGIYALWKKYIKDGSNT